VEARVWK